MANQAGKEATSVPSSGSRSRCIQMSGGPYWLFSDPTNIPEQASNGRPLPGIRCFYGLASFGEGMFHRLWTPATGCGILAYSEGIAPNMSLMGQGDNQILICDQPKDEAPHATQGRLLEALETYSREANVRIKTAETFVSSVYMEYGKNCYHRGVKINNGLKRSRGIGTESQENLPSLNTKLSGICATAISAAAESVTPAAAYVTAGIECLIEVRKRKMITDKNRLATILLLNRQMGGLKISPYAAYCMRGINDLNPVVVSLWNLIRDSPMYQGLWKSLRSMPASLGKLNMEQVLRDPYSLPVTRPEDGDSGVREKVEVVLRAQCKNKDLTRLLDLNAESAKSNLIETLTSLTPMCPKVAASLYEQSNVAQSEKVITTFQTSSSVAGLLKTAYSFYTLIKDAKTRDYEMVQNLADVSPSGSFGPHPVVAALKCIKNAGCPTNACDQLRTKLHNKELINPSEACVQHQTLLRRFDDISPHLMPRTVKINVASSMSDPNRERGDHASYIGSDTRLKRTKSPAVLVNPDPLEVSAMRLSELYTWLASDDSMRELIETLIREKTLTPIDVIQQASSQIRGGTFEHRGVLSIMSRGAHINFNPAVMSHITFFTENATDFAKKGGDFTIMFQGVMIRTASVLVHRQIYLQEDVSGEWGAILACDTCSRPVYEGEYSIAARGRYQGLPYGVERHMVFKPRGRPVSSRARPMKELSGAGHTYLAEQLVSRAMQYDHLETTTELPLAANAKSFCLNPTVSLTDVKACNVNTLVDAVVQRLMIRGDAYEIVQALASSSIAGRANPCLLIIDPILAGGRVQEIIQVSGSCATVEELTIRKRSLIMREAIVARKDTAIRNWKWLLPEDPPECRARAVTLKASAKGHNFGALSNVMSLQEGELSSLEAKLDIEVTPPPLDCQKALRGSPPPAPPLCRLEPGKPGVYPSIDPVRQARLKTDETVYVNLSVSYGGNVAASQVWSLLPLFPQSAHCWTIGDKGGHIGIIAGHYFSTPISINDSFGKAYEVYALNNGPEGLYNDLCFLFFELSSKIGAIFSKNDTKMAITRNIKIVKI